MSGQIAEFWASLGFKIAPDEIKKVDKFLGDAEKKLKGTNRRKTEEAKATTQVAKAVDKEVKSKKQAVKADVEANKAIEQKAKAVDKLSAAEVRRARKLGAAMTPLRRVDTTVLNRINRMFPSMGVGVAKGDDRSLITSMYGGLFKLADAGKVGRRSPAILEAAALNKLGINNPRFSKGGRVTEYLRAKALQPELSALGRIGQRSGSFKPIGWAMSQFDGRLNQLQRAGQASIAARQRAGFMARVNDRLSYLAGPSKSDELKSMANFYRQQERFAREELKLKKQGLRTEQQVERTRRQGMITERARNFQNRLSSWMGGGGAGGGSGAGGGGGTTILGSGGRNAASYGRANYLHAGGATGAFMRYGIGSLPFIGGMYGIGALNRANQEAISTRLTTQAVVQGYGMEEQVGVEAFDWLRNLGNEVGFSYMDASQDYNQFLANALGAGLGIDGSQDIFQGMAEYQTAMGVTPYRRKLVNNALNQMLG